MPWLRRFAQVACNTFDAMDDAAAFNLAQRERAAQINAEGRARVSVQRAKKLGLEIDPAKMFNVHHARLRDDLDLCDANEAAEPDRDG